MSSRTARRAAQSLLSLFAGVVGVSLVLAAVMDAALLGGGLVVKHKADAFLALPAALDVSPVPVRSVVLDAAGQPLAWFWEANRVPVPLAQVSPLMREAIVDTEDVRFYENSGVDVRAALRAALVNQAGSGHQGGSTITQQYVKNLRLYGSRSALERASAAQDSYQRKASEARIALALRTRMSKDQILEGYLNTVYFGAQAYGIQAASERYFSTSAAALTLPQAALLAGLVQNPSALDPTRHPQAALARRGEVLNRMLAAGHLTPVAAQALRATPLGLRPREVVRGCPGTAAGFFCELVLRQLLTDPLLGDSPLHRQARLDRGGVVVRTTLDPHVQAAALAAVRAPHLGGGPVLASASVTPGTGAVTALAASLGFGVGPGETSVNLPLGGSSGFQAGSTFKAFTLATALAQNKPRTLPLYSPQHYASKVFTRGAGGPPGSDPGAPYEVSNAGDSEAGVFTLEDATWKSVNTYYVQLEEQVGVAPVADLAERLGVHPLTAPALPRIPSLTLGTAEVSPLSMAGAYAAFAAHGRWCAPYVLTSVEVPGSPPERHAPACSQVLDPGVADTTADVLRGVLTKGTGVAAQPGRPAFGKTGTVENFSAAWFVGATPELASAVWMGDPRGGFSHPLRDVTAFGHHYTQVFGGDVAAPVWGLLTRTALAGKPVREFQFTLLPQPRTPPPLVLPPGLTLPPGTPLPPGVSVAAPTPSPQPGATTSPGGSPTPSPTAATSASASPAPRPSSTPSPSPTPSRSTPPHR